MLCALAKGNPADCLYNLPSAFENIDVGSGVV